jgi:hypothetical protein
MAMDKKTEEKTKKKSFFALLKESMIKTSEGCGPGCGCHVADEKDKGKDIEDDKDKKNK